MSMLSKYKTNLNRKKNKKTMDQNKTETKKKSYNHIYTIYTYLYKNFAFFYNWFFQFTTCFPDYVSVKTYRGKGSTPQTLKRKIIACHVNL